MPTQASAGWRALPTGSATCIASGPVRNTLAEQPRRPEDQDQDQHDEREHVLVVRAEELEMRIAGAALRDRVKPARQSAKIGELADVAGAERLDDAHQKTAEHRAGEIADAAEHGGREGLEPEQETHLIV